MSEMPGLGEQIDDFDPPDKGSHRWKEWKNKNTTREDTFKILQRYHQNRVMPLYQQVQYLSMPFYRRWWLAGRQLIKDLWAKIPVEYRRPVEQWIREHVTGPIRVYWEKAKARQFGWKPVREFFSGLFESDGVPCDECGAPADTSEPVGPDDQYLCGDCLQENLEAI